MAQRVILRRFTFPDGDEEFDFRLWKVKRTCYDTVYPFHVLSGRGLREIEFEPITILYGGNGSGKTTALNVIAETLGLKRESLFNRSNFFEDYTAMCRYELASPPGEDSRVITSDDVFDYMLNMRAVNSGIDAKREELLETYIEDRNNREFRLRSLDDYDELRRINAARRKTQSKYVRMNLKDNIPERSNGESAFMYFTDKIRQDGLYLLDEPENSLAPSRQLELSAFLQDSARFYGCQFVIATHSPFLMAMKGARIYDLDADPARVKRWTELEAVRAYYDFFMEHRQAFESDT